LVSGLLFREYSKFGDIKPKLFLIRRGFKIYPIYYIFYWMYLIPKLYLDDGGFRKNFDLIPFLSDMFFVQNYVCSWGYAFAHSWSLPVEEHFYFGFAIAMYFAVKKGADYFSQQNDSKPNRFEKTILLILVLCLVMRVLSNVFLPPEQFAGRNFTNTHLRIDSLLAGVLVSYWHHFRKEKLREIMTAYRRPLLLLAVALVSFSPFVE